MIDIVSVMSWAAIGKDMGAVVLSESTGFDWIGLEHIYSRGISIRELSIKYNGKQ